MTANKVLIDEYNSTDPDFNSWVHTSVANTLHNNKLVLKLAQNGQTVTAMKLLHHILDYDGVSRMSSLCFMFRSDNICSDFSDDDFGDIDYFKFHPELVDKETAVKVAKANLSLISNLADFFKSLSKKNVHTSLHWLADYYYFFNKKPYASNNPLGKAHICDFYGEFVYMISKHPSTPSEEYEGIFKGSKTRKITEDDIQSLINILRKTKTPNELTTTQSLKLLRISPFNVKSIKQVPYTVK